MGFYSDEVLLSPVYLCCDVDHASVSINLKFATPIIRHRLDGILHFSISLAVSICSLNLKQQYTMVFIR